MKRIKGEFKLKLVISGAIIFALGILITSIGELQGGNLYRALTQATQSMGIEVGTNSDYTPNKRDKSDKDEKEKEKEKDKPKSKSPKSREDDGSYGYNDDFGLGDSQMREFFREFGMSDEEIDMFFGDGLGGYGESDADDYDDYQTVPGYDKNGREYY